MLKVRSSPVSIIFLLLFVKAPYKNGSSSVMLVEIALSSLSFVYSLPIEFVFGSVRSPEIGITVNLSSFFEDS